MKCTDFSEGYANVSPSFTSRASPRLRKEQCNQSCQKCFTQNARDENLQKLHTTAALNLEMDCIMSRTEKTASLESSRLFPQVQVYADISCNSGVSPVSRHDACSHKCKCMLTSVATVVFHLSRGMTSVLTSASVC